MASQSDIKKAYGAWVLTRQGATEGERKAAQNRLNHFMKDRGVTNAELMSHNTAQSAQSQRNPSPPKYQQRPTQSRFEGNEEAFRRQQAKETKAAAEKRYADAQRAAASQKVQISKMMKEREEWQKRSDALHARPNREEGRAWNGKKKGFSLWDLF